MWSFATPVRAFKAWLGWLICSGWDSIRSWGCSRLVQGSHGVTGQIPAPSHGIWDGKGKNDGKRSWFSICGRWLLLQHFAINLLYSCSFPQLRREGVTGEITDQPCCSIQLLHLPKIPNKTWALSNLPECWSSSTFLLNSKNSLEWLEFLGGIPGQLALEGQTEAVSDVVEVSCDRECLPMEKPAGKSVPPCQRAAATRKIRSAEHLEKLPQLKGFSCLSPRHSWHFPFLGISSQGLNSRSKEWNGRSMDDFYLFHSIS